MSESEKCRACRQPINRASLVTELIALGEDNRQGCIEVAGTSKFCSLRCSLFFASLEPKLQASWYANRPQAEANSRTTETGRTSPWPDQRATISVDSRGALP